MNYFTLAAWISRREHGLATFSHEYLAGPLWINPWRGRRLSGCVLTVMVARLSLSTNHKPRNSHQQPFQCFHIIVFTQVILTASTLTGVIITNPDGKCWLTGQPWKSFSSFITLKMPLAPSLVTGTLEPNPTWFLQGEYLNSSELDRRTLKKFSRSQY